MSRVLGIFGLVVLSAVIAGSIAFSFSALLALNIRLEQDQPLPTTFEQFPVTVDPKNKLIAENEEVNAFFEDARSPYQAAVGNVQNVLGNVFEWVALTVSAVPWYQSLAAAAGNRLVAITPGMRKEQAANAFASALGWDNKQKREFLAAREGSPLPLPEGSFSSGIYSVTMGATPATAQALVNQRFTKEVLSRYGTTTAEIVPLDQALTIASLIEREAGGPGDMRFISGIIWNRLFVNMNLQIDATLQYAKANRVETASWWPKVVPADRFRASPYNTYLHPGLPPTPIANPSVASILAALNPKNTSCLFYFHDAARQFHCTDTYAEHIALLKKYYGRGK